MARVFITGSADGLGRATAQTLLDQGHEIVVHARSQDRLAAAHDLLDRGASAVAGDLSDLAQTRAVANQVNRLGPMDAVIHNAGVVSGPHVLPVNVVAPYLLTALIDRPQRLVYLSSGMHHGGRANLAGVDWGGRRSRGSYSDSKLFVTTLAAAVARIWRDVLSNAVDPGWVPTKMGGPGAPDDLRLGHLTRGSPPATIRKRAPPAVTGITSAAPSRPRASATEASRTNCSRRWLASPARASCDAVPPRVPCAWFSSSRSTRSRGSTAPQPRTAECAQ